MADSGDPREALSNKDVSVRAAAVRQVARIGTLDDAMDLVGRALTDKSPSVRLYAAAAVADIAMRHAASLSGAQGDALVAAITGGDPGRNPSLLMALAAVPTVDVIRRLGRILRDPHYDVRAGAATAVRLMAMSAVHADSATATKALCTGMAAWLSSGRHPADAILELIRIVGEAGLHPLADAIRAHAGRGQGAAVELALTQLKAREDPSTWEGFWVSWGTDVLQPEPAIPTNWLLVGADAVVGPADVLGPMAIDAGTARIGDRSVRLVWAGRPGEEGQHPAIQLAGIAYWRRSGKDLVDAATSLLHSVEHHPFAAGALLGALDGVDRVSAKRLRARLLWRAGQLDLARSMLAELTDVKKPKGEDLWVLAHVHHALDEPAAARDAIARAIAAAPKKAAWLSDAEALKQSLAP